MIVQIKYIIIMYKWLKIYLFILLQTTWERVYILYILVKDSQVPEHSSLLDT